VDSRGAVLDCLAKMKTKLITAICVVSLLGAGATPCLASSDDDMQVVTDAIIVRPACLVATVVGSALFIVALPFAAMSKSVKKTAHQLVVRPARATFSRPLGDMEALNDN
jgi:hypothetical protein